MYMVDHDIILTAHIATPTNWTRYRGPFAPQGVAIRQNENSAATYAWDKSLGFPIRHCVTLLYVSDDPLK